MSPNTSEQQPGLVERPAGSPRQALSTSTHQHVAANGSSTGTTTHGRNSQANGAVSRRVTPGSDDDDLEAQREQRVRLRRALGCAPSGAAEQAQRLSLPSRLRTSSARDVLPIRSPSWSASSVGVAPSVDELEQRVEQRGDLQRLAVAAPDQAGVSR